MSDTAGSDYILETRNVSRVYEMGHTKVEALKNINLRIKRGAFMTITGPSGSGKSTLLNIIGLLDAPTSGQLFLEGKPFVMRDFDAVADTRAHFISFIFQTFNLIPVLTVEENVMIPLAIRPDIPKAERQRRVEEWVRKVGLWEHRRHKPDELSGGQRQRVSIARAMVSYPQMVLADEPTANLDSKTARSILELMRDLNRERKTTFVFSTHDPHIQEFARETWHISDGEIFRQSDSDGSPSGS